MIYCDMDGFLFTYDYNDYKHEDGKLDWNELGAHTFRHKEPDKFARSVIRRVATVMPDDIGILTSVDDKHGVLAKNEQIFDKLLDLQDHYDFINLCNFMSCVSDKRNAIAKIKGMHLSKSDILIDDYNKNLTAWVSAGGTAIKYVNGINSVGRWPGPYIDSTTMSVEDAVSIIMKVWYESC